MYNFQELKEILTLEYFTIEQINFIALKLIDKRNYSLYLQSVMASDMKKIKS